MCLKDIQTVRALYCSAPIDHHYYIMYLSNVIVNIVLLVLSRDGTELQSSQIPRNKNY